MGEDKGERSKDKGDERRIRRQIRVKNMQKRLQMALGKSMESTDGGSTYDLGCKKRLILTASPPNALCSMQLSYNTRLSLQEQSSVRF